MEATSSAVMNQEILFTEDTSLPDGLRERLKVYWKRGSAHDAEGATARVPIDDGAALKYMCRCGYRVLTGEALLTWEGSATGPVRKHGLLFLPMMKELLDEAIRIETSYLPAYLKERDDYEDVFRHELRKILSEYMSEDESRGIVMIDEKGRVLGYSAYTLRFNPDGEPPGCSASIDHSAIRPELRHTGLLEQLYAHTLYILESVGAERITTNVLMNGPRSRRRLSVLHKLGFTASGSNLILKRDSMHAWRSRGRDSSEGSIRHDSFIQTIQPTGKGDMR